MNRDLTRGFLADIVANPEDDTPRLVFADWLEENGQEERAEFIRVQIERARLPKWEAAQVRLRVREAQLLATNGAAWRAALPRLEGVEWAGFRRGFVAEARLASFATLRQEGWREAAPVEAVSVRWPRRGETDGLGAIPGLRELRIAGQLVAHEDADRLAASGLLSTLRVLDIKGCASGMEGLRRLVSSPHLGRLEALRAADNSIGDGVGEVLREAPALERLEELDLSESEDAGYYGEDVFTAEGMTELGTWPGMARLRRLDLSGHDFRRGQLQALLGSPLSGGLKELRFRNNHNYEGFGEILQSARPEMELDILDITGAQDRGDVPLLVENRALRNLKELFLRDSFHEEPSGDIEELAAAPFMASLRALHLEGGETDEAEIGPLLDAAPPLLHTLSLLYVYFLSPRNIVELAESPASDNLLELDLRDSRLDSKAVEALGKAKHLRNLLVLRVGGRDISEAEMDAIAASPLGRRLMLLDRPGR
jgi:uncharacterized protein (TIGR02996 family)